MVNRALCLLLLVASCYEDRYRCDERDQCDVGEGGRCEIDDYCTQRELTCDTLRAYTEHSAELSGQCFDDTIAPLNACAGGQPAAKPESACLTQVCERLPACCKVGWTDACAQLAQETVACELDCDLRIAITAVRGSVTEHWDVRWVGGQWTFDQRNELEAMSWVAPAPGSTEPRLAGSTGSELVIGESRIPIEPGRQYGSITSVAFDRDRRDTIVATFNLDGNKLEVVKLDDLTSKVFAGYGLSGLGWGDENRDTYPDSVLEADPNTYTFIHNIADDNFDRRFFNQTRVDVSIGTAGAPQIRSFDWLDFNGDAKLDLAMFGSDLRIHMNDAGLNEGARQIDCDPPTQARECATSTGPKLDMVSFAGVALPTMTAPSLVIATYPNRKLFRVYPNGDITPLAFPGDSCTCAATCMNCPGPDCSCTYNCNTCVPVLALVARDIDADHLLDLIAIDAKLNLYIAKGANGYLWGGPTQVPTAFPNTFVSVDVSVSGAPIP